MRIFLRLTASTLKIIDQSINLSAKSGIKPRCFSAKLSDAISIKRYTIRRVNFTLYDSRLCILCIVCYA